MLRDQIASRLSDFRARGERVSYAAVARELGCCAKWVAIVARRMESAVPLRRYRHWPPERRAVLVSLVELGYQVRVVARWADIDRAYLSRMRLSASEPAPTRPRAPRRP